jgi:hypothetical protein
MNRSSLNNWVPFNNILYIGDEPKDCLKIMERFNTELLCIENSYAHWFSRRKAKHSSLMPDKLQYHIHYHFEGGIAIFKFRDEDELPDVIRKECISACRHLAAGQPMYVS